MNSSSLASVFKQFYKPLLMVLGIVLVAFLARYFHGLDLFLSDHHLLKRGIEGQAIFLLVAILMCAIGFPRQVVCLTAGVVYGFWLGFLYATIATIVGAVITYSWALWLGKDWGKKYLAHSKLKKINRFIQDNPFNAVLMCRLMPIGSSVVLNTTAGVVGIGWLPFLGATFLGSMPQTIVFVLLGGGVRIGHTGQIILSAVLFVMSAGLGIFLMKRSFSKKNDLLLP
ncbi:TVP38/TMEM64 family protein [Commensalibacter intestini]|nr:VTT domain-containing protein [Commensalibacter intestini]